MKVILRASWHGKPVIVWSDRYYLINGLGNTVRLKIKVEDTYLLPEKFIKGTIHKANLDIIDTVGGLPKYIGKMLDNAAKREYARLARTLNEQYAFDFDGRA